MASYWQILGVPVRVGKDDDIGEFLDQYQGSRGKLVRQALREYIARQEMEQASSQTEAKSESESSGRGGSKKTARAKQKQEKQEVVASGVAG